MPEAAVVKIPHDEMVAKSVSAGPGAPATDRKTILRLLQMIRSMWLQLILALISTVVVTGATLALPWSVKYFIDGMVDGNSDTLSTLAIALVLLFAVQGIFSAAQIYLLAHVGQRFVSNLMAKVYSRLQHLSVGFFDRERTGELISRITNDTTLLRQLVSNGLVDGVSQVFTVIGAVTLVFVLDWQMSLMILLAVPFIVAVGSMFGRLVRRATDELQGRIADITATMEQRLGGIRIVKSLARESYEADRFAARTEELYYASMKQARITAILTPVVTIVIMAVIIGVLYYGGTRVVAGTLSPGDLVAFLLYMMMMSGPVTQLTGLYTELQQALAASDRIFSLLDSEEETKSKSDSIELTEMKGHVQFKQVCFSYHSGEEILRSIDFAARPGELVAVVGPSGAGKTTLISLIMRFYDVSAGTVLVDGEDVRDLDLKHLRTHIGLVAQETLLFAGTIRENIRYGRLIATDKEVEDAAKAANAHDFISAFPGGYETLVGERGVRLSGGQRQRIAIARTLLSDPSILILDEATSSLDADSEFQVWEALDRLMKGRTTFVIAHRLSTVASADSIIVLDKGQIITSGSHEELLFSSELYQRLYARQFYAQQGTGSR